MVTIIIKSVSVSNFKTFNDLNVPLTDLNIIIGPNASGKSNFIQVFRFFKDIAVYGLENAISLQGGSEFLLNSKNKTEDTLAFRIIIESLNVGIPILSREEITSIDDSKPIFDRADRLLFEKIDYQFKLKFYGGDGKYEIIEDKLVCTIRYSCAKKNDGHFEKGIFKNSAGSDRVSLGTFEHISTYREGKVHVEIKNNTFDISPYKERIIQLYHRPDQSILPKQLMVETEPNICLFLLKGAFRGIKVIDIDPKLSKKGMSITGKKELEEDGSNLAIIIRDLMKDQDKKRDFLNIVKDLLPFVDNFDVKKDSGKTMYFKMKETYNSEYWPSHFLSDGTINIIALIIVLYFEDMDVLILEEPERNVHPMLISKIVGMLNEIAKSNEILKKKQIILTTHNPEFVKNTDLSDLLLVTRDKEGSSKLSKPLEIETVKAFLESDLGIEELYVRNLLRE